MLKKALPYAKKNSKSQPQAMGKAIVKHGKDASALYEKVVRRDMMLKAELDGMDGLDDLMAKMPDKTDDPNEISRCKALIEA